MIKQINFNKYSIEPLLFLLDKLQNDDENAEEQAEKAFLSDIILTVDEQKMQIAYSILKFVEEMPGGFFIYRADGNEEILYANKAMLRIFDCDTMEEFQALTKGSFRGIVHPEDIEGVERSIKDQIEFSSYDMDYVEYRIITKGGEVRWLDDYGHFIHSESHGDIFYVFVGDATEKKISQQQERDTLRNSQKQQQLQIEEYDHELKGIQQAHFRHLEVIEGLSIDYESIFYVELDRNRIEAYRVSKRFEREFPKGKPVRDFEGFDREYIRDWVHPDDQKNLEGISDCAFIREKLSVVNIFHTNYRVWEKGKVKYIQLRIAQAGNEENISRVVMGYRNVDEEIIREMQQKEMLSDALDKANQANNAQNLFLSNMSHDIRTPMNAIVGLAGLARKKLEDKETLSGYLDGIKDASDQLLTLLNDVLEISRMESGKIFVDEEKANLLEIMYHVHSDQLPKAAAKSISLTLDVSDVKYADVYIDRNKLLQILTYLVDNAVKYTEPKGHVEFMVKQKEEGREDFVSYQFIVEDNGIGMEESFQASLFKPFAREKNTTMSGVSGTGLGLTITKHLVDMIGGTIEVYSKVGVGSRFVVTLPLRLQSEQKEYKHKTEEDELHFTGQKRILIVDDNDINLEIERQVLKEVGFLVELARDGSIAVDMVAQSAPGHYDLILMDIQMPVMDGYRATKAIRGMDNPIKASIPILAVSANTFEEDRKASLESGMNEHLGKPIDVKQLYAQLRKFLAS